MIRRLNTLLGDVARCQHSLSCFETMHTMSVQVESNFWVTLTCDMVTIHLARCQRRRTDRAFGIISIFV